jgi:hypothetical protein
MERISVTVFFVVALIAAIVWQAPPHVYRNVSMYYETLTKGRRPVQGTNNGQSPTRKPVRKSSTKRADDVRTASFNPLDNATTENRSETAGMETAPGTSGSKSGSSATSARKPGKQTPQTEDTKRN